MLAVKVRLYVLPVPAAGVPLNMPFEVLKLMPVGSVPPSDTVGVGEPVAVTKNEPALPAINVVLFALVIAGGEPPGGAVPGLIFITVL